MAKEEKKAKKATWVSPAEKEKADEEALQQLEKDKTAWFDRDEHKTPRTCVCLCGNTFKTQARELQCLAVRKVKDKDGQDVFGKDGKPKTEPVTVTKYLTKTTCPKCSSNWIESFT